VKLHLRRKINLKFNTMKNLLLLFAFLVPGSFYITHAQLDDFENKNDFRVGIFSMVVSTIDLQYERLLAPDKSINLKGAVKYKDNGYDKEIGLMGELQFRYYLLTNTRSGYYPFDMGLYAAPYGFFKVLEDDQPDIYSYFDEVHQNWVEFSDPVRYESYGFGVYAGFKGVMFKKLTVDLNFGGGLKITESNAPNNYSYDVFDDGFSGVVPRGNFSVGFLF
jgi:hypothetical protein